MLCTLNQINRPVRKIYYRKDFKYAHLQLTNTLEICTVKKKKHSPHTSPPFTQENGLIHNRPCCRQSCLWRGWLTWWLAASYSGLECGFI
jgi:hypothetical protein